MRRNYFAGASSKRLAFIDLVITAASLGVAVAIRANFQNFFVTATGVAVIGPFVILARPATMYLFEHYSYSPTIWHSRDVVSMFAHNTAPTAILIVLRLISPISALRLPLSIILMEYVLSVALMLLVRATTAGVGRRESSRIIHRPVIALYGEVQDIRHDKDVSQLLRRDNLSVIAIITPNPLHWDSDLDGVRVVGGENSIPQLMQADDRLSTIVVIGARFLPAARLLHLQDVVQAHNLALIDKDGHVLSDHRLDALNQDPEKSTISR